MSRHRFTQLDVFTRHLTLGNPLAVVHDANELTTAQMAAFANWTQLSETTFLLTPTHEEADYRVRIFTPVEELAFAGHPTLGSCMAFLQAGGQPKNKDMIIQQCAVGLVRVRRGEHLAFCAPNVVMQAVSDEDLQITCRALNISLGDVVASQWLDNGTKWIALLLASAEQVLAVEPDHGLLAQHAKVGIVGPYSPRADALVEVRAFVDPAGIPEDPVTGSLNAMLAQWLMHIEKVPEAYVASQGTRLKRAGRVLVQKDSAGIWIGGDVVVGIEGFVRF